MISKYNKRCLPKGVDTKINTKAELMELTKVNSISTEINVTDKMVECCLGNPKGMLQILWEFIFIDEN